jgi:hypothetical protein
LDPTNINAFSPYFDETVAVDSFALVVPDDWPSWRVAKLTFDAASGNAGNEFGEIKDAFDEYLANAISITDEARDEIDDAADGENPYDDVATQAIQLAEFDPENIPNERIQHLLETGQAEMFTAVIGRKSFHAVAMWIPLADGAFRSLIIERVNAGVFSAGRWRIKTVGPGKADGPGGTWELKELVDAYIFGGREAEQAESNAAAAEFVLHVIPLGAFADYAAQGNVTEATISIAGDVAMLLTGGGSKLVASGIVSGSKAKRVTGHVTRGIGLITEGGIASIRGWQGVTKLANGDGGHGEIAEALLRIFGIRYNVKSHAKTIARAQRQVETKALNWSPKPSLLDEGFEAELFDFLSEDPEYAFSRFYDTSNGQLRISSMTTRIEDKTLIVEDVSIFPEPYESGKKLELGFSEMRGILQELADEMGEAGFERVIISGERISGAYEGKFAVYRLRPRGLK